MNVVTAIVVYAIIWFMTLFLVLPIRQTTQADLGKRVEGTPGSAPSNPHLRWRVLVTSGIASVIWALVMWIVIWDVLTIEDIDLFSRFGLGEANY